MSVSKGFDTRSVAVVTTPSWISCTFLLHHIHPSTAACMFQYRAETVQLFVLHGIVAEALSWKKSNLFKKKSPARLHYPFPPTTLWVISKSLLKIPPHTSEERVIFAPSLEKIFYRQNIDRKLLTYWQDQKSHSTKQTDILLDACRPSAEPSLKPSHSTTENNFDCCLICCLGAAFLQHKLTSCLTFVIH